MFFMRTRWFIHLCIYAYVNIYIHFHLLYVNLYVASVLLRDHHDDALWRTELSDNTTTFKLQYLSCPATANGNDPKLTPGG